MCFLPSTLKYMRKIAVLGWILLGVFAACAPNQKDIREAEALFQRLSKPSQEPITEKVLLDAIEKSIAQYVSYSDTHPSDPLSPEYLYKAAQLCAALPNQTQRQLAVLTELKVRFPKSEFAAKGLLAEAHVYRNTLRDTLQARSCYTQFLQRFPAHELAPLVKQQYQELIVP